MSWRDLLLGDLLTLQRGFDITKAQQSAGPFPVVSSSGANSFHSEFKCNGPGVVIGRKGTLGTAFFLEGAYWPHDTSLWVKDFKGNDPRFCYYLLKSLGLEKYDVGSSNPTLNRNHLHLLPARAPWPDVQIRIAEILSAYDDLIKNNTRRIATLEDMARRLFEEWFGQDADHGMPDLVRIDELIDFDPKTKVAKEGLKRFLPMPRVPTNSMVVSQWEEREGNAGSKFLNGDTLLARITPCLENGKTAFVDFLPDGTAGFGSTEFIVMRGRVVPPEFVYCLARSDAFRDHAIKSMSGATGRQRVSSAAVAQFEIASPQPEQLEKFGQAAKPMFSMIRSLADANTNLRTTRDLLLPKLISGEIEVRAPEEELEAAAP